MPGSETVSPGSCGRLVVLLHDQLQDDRIWGELRRRVARLAAVQTLSVPPLHVLGPAAWAEHIGRYARAAVSPGTADLVVTVGGAAGAGIGLVCDGYARAALLLDPDPEPVIGNDAGHRRQMHQMLAEPDVTHKLMHLFDSLGPDAIEELAVCGTLSDERIRILVDVSLGNDEHLGRREREFLRRIAIEQLAATLPLDIEAQRLCSPEDWTARLATVAHRCTVATSTSRLYRELDFDAALRRRAPGVEIIRLASRPASAWISTPHEIATLINTLVWRADPHP